MAELRMREALRDAMAEEMRRDEAVFVMGEDVSVFQGAFKVTEGLLQEFGERRVRDTPISENTIVGTGVGAAMGGLFGKLGKSGINDQFRGQVQEMLKPGTAAVVIMAAKITEDLDVLLAFFDYPAEHWVHLRTTNPIESTFATVRLRTRVTKGPGSRAAGVAMAYKLIEAAQDRWRAVNAPHLVALVRAGATFSKGILVERPPDKNTETQVA
jgi:hypothetical protein